MKTITIDGRELNDYEAALVVLGLRYLIQSECSKAVDFLKADNTKDYTASTVRARDTEKLADEIGG